MTDAATALGITILQPQFTLKGICEQHIQDQMGALVECTNSTPWMRFAAGELYITDIEIGGHNGPGPFEIGFRRRTQAKGNFDDQEAIDFATLPVGEWSEV